MYPHGFHKTDKLGHPVYYERYEFIDYNEFLNITTIDNMQKYWI